MTPPNLIPLDKSVWCANCNRISDSTGSCIGCGSVGLMNLARVLDRKPLEDELVPDTEVDRLVKMVEDAMRNAAAQNEGDVA